MIKKITQKEIKELLTLVKKYKNFGSIIFFISNNTLYKEIHVIGQSLSDVYKNRDYISAIELEEEFIFDTEHTQLDNIRDIQLNVNSLVNEYNQGL
jgi:hypothetical protein